MDLFKLDSRRPGSATFQVESKTGSRNPDPTTTDQCASPAGTEATASQQYRSFSVCLALSLVSLRPGRGCDCQAGNDHSLAPCFGFRAYWRWRSRNRVGKPKISAELRTLIGEMSRARTHSGAPHTFTGSCSSSVRGRSVDSRSVYVPWLGAPVSGLANVSQQPCRHRGGRPFCPANDRVRSYCLVIIRHG